MQPDPIDIVSSLPSKVQTLLSMKGQIVTMLIGREGKMRKGVAPVYKFTRMQVRVGVNYDNIAAVQAKRESGELPAENAGRSWGEYVPGFFPYLITHKGQLYFHFSTVNTSMKSETKWVRNDKEITVEEAKAACLASEFAERESTLECFDLKVESILEINGVSV
jgi:hypothetical protein